MCRTLPKVRTGGREIEAIEVDPCLGAPLCASLLNLRPQVAENPVAAPNEKEFADALARVGKTLGEREAAHAAGLEAARGKADELHARVRRALDGYHAAIEAAGSSHLRVEVGEPRLDEKHVRSYEFELKRGRHRGLFILKSRGELTLVGPFRTGKTEGPCRSFPFASEAGAAGSEIDNALVEFVTRFLEEAATP